MTQPEFFKIPQSDDLHELLLSQKKSERMQRARLLIQIFTSLVILALVVALYSQLVPAVAPVVRQVEDLSATVSELAVNTNTLITELNDADLSGTLERARTAIESASQNMASAMGKLDKIDFDALNTSIQALSAAVDAIAQMFGM